LEDRNADASFGMTTGVASMSIAYQHVEEPALNAANATPWASWSALKSMTWKEMQFAVVALHEPVVQVNSGACAVRS
jgi:hypothetical protein